MEEINIEARDRYYKELAIRLTGEGYSVEPMKDGLLPVRWLGEPLCRVTAGGGAQFREEELDRDGGREAFDRAVDVAREVRQYMELMDAAPVLKASGLELQAPRRFRRRCAGGASHLAWCQVRHMGVDLRPHRRMGGALL